MRPWVSAAELGFSVSLHLRGSLCGWVMHTLGLAALSAGLGSGSAGWGVAPGGFVRPWVRAAELRFSVSLRLRGGLCGQTATVVASCAVAPCWCVAGWCGALRGVRRLVFGYTFG